jgi:membrane protease YdiL (CAAX protease family)
MATDKLSLRKNRNALFVILLISYCVPAFLLWVKIIPFDFRFQTLVVMTIAMIGYAVIRKFTLKDLGFRADTLRGSLTWTGCLLVVVMAALGILYAANVLGEPTMLSGTGFYLFYVFVSGPSQEFLCRSTIFAEMKRAKITGPLLQVSISATTYCFLHIFYGDLLTLSVTLLMGTIWGVIYYKYPNFWGVAFSHAVLGAVSIKLGLI